MSKRLAFLSTLITRFISAICTLLSKNFNEKVIAYYEGVGLATAKINKSLY